MSLSRYKDQFILKGGMLVAAMVGIDVRSTMDIDATLKGSDVNVDEVKRIISEIIQTPVEDGVVFRVKQVDTIMDEFEYLELA